MNMKRETVIVPKKEAEILKRRITGIQKKGDRRKPKYFSWMGTGKNLHKTEI